MGSSARPDTDSAASSRASKAIAPPSAPCLFFLNGSSALSLSHAVDKQCGSLAGLLWSACGIEWSTARPFSAGSDGSC